MRPCCSEVQKRLPLYLDGELPASEGAAVAAHLEACPACAWQAAGLRWWASTLADLPVPDPPADFAAQVRARLAARQAERAARRPRRWALGLALAAAVGGLTALLPPFPLPWGRWEAGIASMQAVWASARSSLAEASHAVTSWWQQACHQVQGLWDLAGALLGGAPHQPWWEAVMHGLGVALGLAIAGNLVSHFLGHLLAKNGGPLRRT
jgi:anti-sigma factor RsiW